MGQPLVHFQGLGSLVEALAGPWSGMNKMEAICQVHCLCWSSLDWAYSRGLDPLGWAVFTPFLLGLVLLL